ncbi:MFS transporter [Streptomyces sp. DH41]|uniref:MFS transporter n=1 Tax=Streptomyces sp. DH41 TaxID=3040125 RepID=UPI0024430853|nr:MFS transporter [Streptomyces sp. DH41]MDG9728399.1 MFS transporter [Streptomyces sp. DH41]
MGARPGPAAVGRCCGFLPGSGLAMAVMALVFLGPEGSAAQRWTVIVALFAYILFAGIGIQAVVWLIGPEIVPLSVRGPATSLATVTLWGVDLLIAVTALTAIQAIGRSGTFFVYALMNVACIAFVAAKVPETRGKSLESIERALPRGGSFRETLRNS